MKMVRMLLAYLSLMCSVVVPSAEEDRDTQAVIEVMNRCYQTLSARDFIALRDCFWPQALITTYWKRSAEAAGPEVYAQYLEEFIVNSQKSLGQFSSFAERSLSHEIKLYGNIAQVWSVYELTFTTVEGKSATWRGVDMFHFMCHEGKWRIVALTFAKEVPSLPLIRPDKRR